MKGMVIILFSLLAILVWAPGAFAQGMMQGQGMTPCQTMMGGMTMGQGMTGPGLGMMPRHVRNCMTLSGGMMRGEMDPSQFQDGMGLSDEQVAKLREAHRPFQKEAIRLGAAMRTAELDLADLLSADKVDMNKVEAKLKEIEGFRTGLALNHLKATEAAKRILTMEQLEKLD